MAIQLIFALDKPNENFQTLTNDLENLIITIINKLKLETYSIDITTVTKARSFVDYANKNKFVLAGYSFDTDIELDIVIQSWVQQHRDTPVVADRFNHLEQHFIMSIKKTLNTSNSLVEPVEVTKGNFNLSLINKVFQFIENFFHLLE